MDSVRLIKDLVGLTYEQKMEEVLSRTRSRRTTYERALRYLDEHNPKVIVETGTCRGDSEKLMMYDSSHWLDWLATDGGSTIIFALWCSQNDAKVYTVDISKENLEYCRKNIETLGLGKFVGFEHSDSVKWLAETKLSDLKFVYLDSYDFDDKNPSPSQQHHLMEYLNLRDKLAKKCHILIDDCALPYGGKGAKVEPKLVMDGFKMVERGYQHAYERE